MIALLSKLTPYALLFLALVVGLVAVIALFFLPWQAAWAALLANPALVIYLVPAVIVALVLVAWVFGRLADWQQAQHHAQVAAILGVVGREAARIAQTLQMHPPAGPDVLEAVKQSLIGDAMTYVQTAMPAFVAATGYTPDKLATALAGAVADRQLVAAAAPSAAALQSSVASVVSALAPGLISAAVSAAAAAVAAPAAPAASAA